MNNKLNLEFLNNVKLVISGGVTIIFLTLAGYVIYTQFNEDSVGSVSNLKGNFFNMVSKFKDDNIYFSNINEIINTEIKNMASTKVPVCPENSKSQEICPIGTGKRPNPFAE